ncbi:MetQ/NlpA family ABC transporter substrate-binding protein [Bacillus testis]|uniref:MetQ/NlpA family ABC transporter substrate-binding protein n=1 Tax=Bacillus testis TaxID=1622072 RepID=UPI00067F5069|nr:MetQ/NlpA family ABC transporter substrate-binding protein [Bacillus testis]
MKKRISLLFVLALTLLLAACGTSDKDDKSSSGDNPKLTVGATNVPHAEILEEAKPLLEKKGIDLKIVKYNDYVMPNKALAEKDLDANYFQHIPYLELQNKENNYGFVNAGGIHIEPIGIYSKKYKKLTDLPKGAEIIMSSSVADHGRVLSLLEAKGLIKLKEGIDKTAATVKDIVDNPKKLKFKTDIDAPLLTQVYKNDEGDAVAINSNFAIDGGLNPLKDSIAIEGSESPYVNVIAVRKEDKDNKDIQTLVDVLHSKEIQDFIKDKYKGAVVPVSE